MTQADDTQENQDKKAQVQSYFGRTAESYVASSSHRSGQDLARLIEIGEWQPDQVALDVATGGGHTALAVAPHVARITASDLTPKMLDHAKAFIISQGITNADFTVADAENLPFLDNSFDRVTCRIAPHHFPDIAKAVREIARVLKPQGLFLLVDSIAPRDQQLDAFINKVEKWRDHSHGRSWTAEEWRSFLTDAGLHIEHEETLQHPLHFDEWAERSQMSANAKAALEHFILASNEETRAYFDVTLTPDKHLESFSNYQILLKARKS